MVERTVSDDLPVLVIYGPTASGKSAAALAAALEFSGTVINADSMQIYADLPILSAAPRPEEMALAPHRLYGVLDAAEAASAQRWRAMAVAEIRAAHRAGRLPIVVGGTGLYLKALIEGLSPIPEIPTDIRAGVRARMADLGPQAMHADLALRDPATAAKLRPSDPQRIARAMEVLEATGKPLVDWQAIPPDGPPPGMRFTTAIIAPPRTQIYARCDMRLAQMIEEGALEEVERLGARNLDPSLPAMKTLGVPDFLAYLRGETDLQSALAAAQKSTRNYAKRQFVWVNHHFITHFFINEQFSEKSKAGFFAFIRESGLTQCTQGH